MILKALYDYYQSNKDFLPQEGFELKEIKFLIIINQEGKFIDLQDLREGRKGKNFLLPRSIERSGSSSWQTAFLLWDHFGYVLAHPKNNSNESIEMANKQQESFLNKIKALPENIKIDEGVKAVLLFYESNQVEEVKKHPNWEDCVKIPGCNLTFRLDNDTELIPQRKLISKYQKKQAFNDRNINDEPQIIETCLITGEKGPIARLHTPTSIAGSKSNAKLISFQKKSGFDSYGKEQAFNAPISVKAESAYSTALKHLIGSSTNKKIISDTTVLFWSEQISTVINAEEVFSWVIASQKVGEDNPDKGVKVIDSLYNAIFTGQLPKERNNHFYVLGLAPNAARISVRFWKMPSVEDFGMNIKQHFDDFKIVHGPKDVQHLTLYQILSATALGYKMENVPPNLAGKVIESVIDGTIYPNTLLQQCIRRIRAEQTVNRSRAAILKAYMNRLNRIYKKNEKEITMALDLANSNSGYRMGRLFAVLEKIQEEANTGINSTIKDRFYGAASSSPVSVFSQLLKLKNHHLPKLPQGRKIYFEKLIGEIMSEISTFPANLALNEQAYFSIGYYHQRQDFFASKKDSEKLETSVNNI